jgi:hypothetical protein
MSPPDPPPDSPPDLRSPTSSEFLAGRQSSKRGSSRPMSGESEDSVLAVLTTVQGDDVVEEMPPLPGQSCNPKTLEQLPPPPRASTHSVMRVDSPSPSTDLMAKATTQPTSHSPEYDPNAEVPDKMPITIPQPEGERPSGPPLSPRLVNLVPQIRGTSHSPTAAHVSVSSSPSRQRETPASAPAGLPQVTVHRTLYSGPSGLWKNFFKVTAAKSVSVLGSPRDKERPKKTSDAVRAELPNNAVSLTRPSHSWKKPEKINFAHSSPGSSENSVTLNDKSKSSVFATGELLGVLFDEVVYLTVLRLRHMSSI